MWNSVGVDGGPGGKELHYPLLCGSYQVCACLRTGILSENILNAQGQILAHVSLRLPESMSTFKDWE